MNGLPPVRATDECRLPRSGEPPILDGDVACLRILMARPVTGRIGPAEEVHWSVRGGPVSRRTGRGCP